MSNGKPKVEIPAWQRASVVRESPPPAPVDDPVYSLPQQSESETTEDVKEVAVSSQEDAPEETPEEPTKQPHVFETADFDSFRQQQAQPPQQQQQQASSIPPIITYPEFLVEAHKPLPLITPTRVLNTLYVAGGISTLLYAASKYLVTPMVDTLNESRHDFLTHSQSKVDELNSRLEKLVSKQPGGKPTSSEMEDDIESVDSDPTELYHRDMGTQTDVPPEPKSSVLKAEEEKKQSPAEYATNGLKIIHSHIEDMADQSDAAGESHKDQKEKMNGLRHYLDQLLYGTVGGPLWTEESIKNAYGNSGAMGGIDGTNGDKKKEDDAIEELKKEIRGVKGVLLSAKRFPPVGRPQTAAA